MKWKIITVGKPSFPWVREGLDMYSKRLRIFAPAEVVTLKKSDPALFLKAAGSAFTIALDEKGRSFPTGQLAEKVQTWEMDAVKEVAVWIGGADGIPPECRKRADLCVSLGPQTLMHELALLVWMEQLYRVYSLNSDHPYHRA